MRTQNHPFRLTAAVAVAGLVVPSDASRRHGALAAQLRRSRSPRRRRTSSRAAIRPRASVGSRASAARYRSIPRTTTQWNPATVNYPVTAGDAFWTEPNAQAEIEVSASRIVDGARHRTRHRDAQRHARSRRRSRRAKSTCGCARWRRTRPTRCRRRAAWSTLCRARALRASCAGDTPDPTTVTVIEGSAQIAGPGRRTAGRSRSDGDGHRQRCLPGRGRAGAARRLPDRDAGQRAATAAAGRRAAARGGGDAGRRGPGAIRLMDREPATTARSGIRRSHRTGCRIAKDAGPMLRRGAGPGWTMKPWGFAPFHYGRWVEIGGRWGWFPGGVPVGVPAPVYAPALVTFLGVGAVVGVGIGAALAAGRIGWCPLGPREPFHPWYRASDRYFRQVNVTHVTNFTTVNRNVTFNNFVNRACRHSRADRSDDRVASGGEFVPAGRSCATRAGAAGDRTAAAAPGTHDVRGDACGRATIEPAARHGTASCRAGSRLPHDAGGRFAGGRGRDYGTSRCAGAAQSCAASDARCRRAAVHRNPTPGDARRARRHTRFGDNAASRHACVCCAGSDTRSSPAGQHRA